MDLLQNTKYVYNVNVVFLKKGFKLKLNKYLASQPRGAHARLAEYLGVSYPQLSSMVSGRLSISPAKCVLIERHTGGKVSRKDLRADWAEIWPEIKGD